jgi:hypothetical protein
MTTLDEFFRTPADSLPDPRLRDWKRRLAQPGVKVALELYQPGAALGVAQTDMNLTFTDNGTTGPTETVAWDDDLNSGLVQLGVRAINTDQEAERFALALRGAFRRAERECGGGYFNSVLLEFLADSDLVRYPEIAEILKHSHALAPSKEGNGASRYSLCREMIADAISGRARELTGPLQYPQEEAKRILVAAIARYLDNRFSVSHRRQLGLL